MSGGLVQVVDGRPSIALADETTRGERSAWAKLLGVRLDPEGIAKLWAGQLWQRTYVRGLVALDAMTVVIGVGAALVGATVANRATVANDVLALGMIPLWAFSLACARVYEMLFLGTGSEEFKRVTLAGIWLTAIIGSTCFIANADVSRLLVGAAIPGVLGLLLVERGIARGLLNRKRRRGDCQHRVVAVGRRRDIEHLASQIKQQTSKGWTIVAVCLPETPLEPILIDGAVVPSGDPNDAAAMAALYGADTIAVTDTGILPTHGLRRLAWELEGTDVHLLISPALTDVAGPRVTVRPLFNLPLLHLEQPQFVGPQRIYKSVTDRIMAGLGLVLLSPVFLAISIAVKLGDGGPVFFRQERVGANGARFRCFKFRSMCVEAEQMLIDLRDENEGGAMLFKIKRDPRITSVGSFLRKTSLDELPQLINVFRGEMSLVGPRPPLPSEVDRYEPDVHRRLLVKPGMTGLWQVSGRSDLTWDEAVRLDLYYVENWSPLVDLGILAKTVTTVLKGSGAY
jgi:exopolysaccharide biosynthesis polyprenyl glycosylphosphotransferase